MSTIKIKTQQQDGYSELKILIAHPMENGRNRDPQTGALIPALFINNLQVSLNQDTLFSADLGGSMAKNPFFTLRIAQLTSGDVIKVIWQDNQANSDSAQYSCA